MYLKKKRMYSLCGLPTHWLYQKNEIKAKITHDQIQISNFFLLKSNVLTEACTCSISIDTKSSKTRYTE